ncbi:MAG: serine/threonine protein kinase [Cyanobacteria bacterium SZAS-4]|nr:serine/threonine protein kinase [Cyanobacteria bacterium SZAS-4]
MSEEDPSAKRTDDVAHEEKDLVVLRESDLAQQKSEERQDKTRITNNRMDAMPSQASTAITSGGIPEPLPNEPEDAFSASKEHIGTIIAGRYRIMDLLGVGGMGSVFKAEHIMLGTSVAIKILNRDLATNTTALKRFAQEAKAASSLKHTNIATVSDYGLTEGGFPYFVMDLLEGKSLQELIAEKESIPWQQAVDFGIQISDAMAYAHSQGIYHRDLKPANIMISQTARGDERATVVDFGIAKFANETQDAQRITQTGEVFGSPLYMSPEQCTGKPLDGRSDVYSFGCLMYEMLTGKVPFIGPNAVATILMQINDPPPSLRSHENQHITVSIPAGLDTVILYCLGKDPADRYSSMDAVKADLQLVKRGLPPTRKSVRRINFKLKAPGLLQTGLVTAFGTVGIFLGMAFWINKWQYEMVPWQINYGNAKYAYEHAEYDQARISAQHGIKLGLAKNASKLELANLYNILGDAQKAMPNGNPNYLTDAQKSYEKAAAVATDKHSIRQKVQAYLDLGDVDKLMGNDRAALKNYDKALAGFNEEYVDNRQKARLLVRKGVTYHNLKEYEQAYQQLQEALALYKAMDETNVPAVIDTLEKLSDSLKASGEPVLAKQFSDEANTLRSGF